MLSLKPFNFLQSVLLFGVAALIFKISLYYVMPLLLEQNMPAFAAFLICYGVPLFLMIVGTFVGLSLEGTLACWKERLRFRKLSPKQLLICLGLFILSFLLTGLLLPTAQIISAVPGLGVPDFFPEILDPNKSVPGKELENFMGVTLHHTYWIIPVYFIFLTFFNILGEELWFRGFILPRQELAWGKLTWLYHGIFWTLFHLPIYPWTIIYLLPTCLAVSYASQKFQNTWAGFTIHYAGNGILALVPIILGVVR